jgi:serine/threonine protein kinase
VEPLTSDDPVTIGPFTLLGRLGAGGMGTVYLGQDADGQRVAVKVIHPQLAADREFRARFGREIALARSVAESWAARVVAADPDSANPWLATE